MEVPVKLAYYQFDGDGDVPYEALLLSHLDWLAIADCIQAAAQAAGIRLSLQTMERLRRTCGYSYLLDRLIDDQPVGDAERLAQAADSYQRLIARSEPDPAAFPNWVNHNLLDVAVLFNNAVAGIRSRRQFEQLMIEIGDLARQKAAASSPLRYSHLLVREGYVFGLLLLECVSEDERRHVRFARLQRWTIGLAIAGVLGDHAYDLPADYERRLTQVRPTFANRLFLAVRCAVSGWRLLLVPASTLSALAWFRRFYKTEEPWRAAAMQALSVYRPLGEEGT